MSKKLLTAFLLILVLPLFFACANGSQEAGSNEPTFSEPIDAAVIYFSATNRTEGIANRMAEVLGVTAAEINPAVPYTSADLNYSDDSCRANQEQDNPDARPEIANDLSSSLDADTLFLGYPIWWGKTPKIIYTFLDTYGTALVGKKIYLFATSGSSGIGTSVSELQQDYPGLDIREGHRFAANASASDIANWINGLN